MTELSGDQSQPQTLNWFGGLIAFLLILELYGLTYGFMFIKIPTENTSNISQITGAVLLQVGIIIGWFFRTSQEAKKQAETISTMAITAAKAQAAANPPPSTTTTTTTSSHAPVVAGTAAPAQTTPTPATVTVPLHAGQTASVVADAPISKEKDMSNQNPKAPGQIIKPDPQPGDDGYVAPDAVHLNAKYDPTKPIQNNPNEPNFNPGP
jgi:cytoskeletal protein RodZ